jgi:hypothetical protein
MLLAILDSFLTAAGAASPGCQDGFGGHAAKGSNTGTM